MSRSATMRPAGAITGRETGLELWVRRPGGSALMGDLIEGVPALAPFYAGHYRDPDAFRRKASAVHSRLPAAHRARLVDAFIPTSDTAAAKLESVLAGGGLAVTTGQQTGLFGGPLYTVYKILSAIRLAESLEPLFGEPVLPVFWIASDDHDWAEVNHTTVVDDADDVHRLALPAPAAAIPVAMSERALPAEVGAVVADFEALLPDTVHAEPLRRLVAQSYRPGTTMAAAFTSLLRGLFEGVDLVLIDSAHPALKRAAAPILARELAHAEAHAGLIREQSDRLVAAGYHAQVAVSADAANVFLHGDAGRDRLSVAAGGWKLRRSRRGYPTGEIERMLADEPTRFSPNVLLRPVVESALIPTVAYVGGPGEVSYFGQIGCLFHAHGIAPPIVVPRHSVTLVEPRIRRLLERFDLEPADVMRPLHEITTEVMHAELPASITGLLERLGTSVEDEYDALADEASAIDPTLRRWVLRLRNRALGDIVKAEHKVTSHMKKRRSQETGQLRRISMNLFPDGSPQERVLNVLPYLARYGPGLLNDVRSAMEVRMDRPAPGWRDVDCSAGMRDRLP